MKKKMVLTKKSRIFVYPELETVHFSITILWVLSLYQMSPIYSTFVYDNFRNLYNILIYFVLWFMFDSSVLLFVSDWLTKEGLLKYCCVLVRAKMHFTSRNIVMK